MPSIVVLRLVMINNFNMSAKHFFLHRVYILQARATNETLCATPTSRALVKRTKRESVDTQCEPNSVLSQGDLMLDIYL